MAVRQRGKQWQADLTLDRQRHRCTFATRAEAEAWQHEARASHVRGLPVDADPPLPLTFADLAAQVMAARWEGTRSADMARCNIRVLVRFFGADTPAAEITTGDVDRFIADRLRAGAKGGTINRLGSTFGCVMKWALKRGHIAAVPEWERRRESEGRSSWLTAEDERDIAATMRQWGLGDQLDAFLVLIDTGLRNSELWRLRARDVDWPTGAITVRGTKTDRPRTVYATRRVAQILERRRDRGLDRLFPYDNRWFRKTWDRVKGHLGHSHSTEWVPYICRHTCASRLVQRGASLPMVQEWMGHTTIQTTMRYAHLCPSNMQTMKGYLEI